MSGNTIIVISVIAFVVFLLFYSLDKEQGDKLKICNENSDKSSEFIISCLKESGSIYLCTSVANDLYCKH